MGLTAEGRYCANFFPAHGTFGQDFSFKDLKAKQRSMISDVTTNNTNDSDLVSRFQAGDQTAFDAIVGLFQNRIYNLCRQILGNAHDAEDAAQDVFVKAYQNLHKFQPKASLYTWFYRIAVNTCIDYKRKTIFSSLFTSFGTPGEGEVREIDPPSTEPSPERLYESVQIEQALQKSLLQISPKLRAAIVLREVEGLAYEEISAILDVSIGTVKSRISRAREELVGYMERAWGRNGFK